MTAQVLTASDQWFCFRWDGTQGSYTIEQQYDVTAPIPPRFVSDWPKKPHTMLKLTCRSLDEAVNWQRGEVEQLRPQLRTDPPHDAGSDEYWTRLLGHLRAELVSEKISHNEWSLRGGFYRILAIVPNRSLDLSLWPH